MFQISVALRNARADVVESSIGVSAILELRTGVQPVNADAANTGTVIARLLLPADWMATAATGTKALTGLWSDLSADAGGTVEHFRVYAADGITCGMQGSVTTAGGGGNMTLDNNVVAFGQAITINTFGWTEPGA